MFQVFSESVHRHGVPDESKMALVLAYKCHNAAEAEDRLKVRHSEKQIAFGRKYEHKRAQLCTGSLQLLHKKVNIKVLYPIEHLSSKSVTAR